jgi:hypothetical protein
MERSWSAQFEVNEESMVTEDLHRAIQTSVRFDNEHLYEFYIGRTWRGRKPIFNDENAEDLALAEVFPLPRKFKLFYLFDFGESWIFEISRSSKKGGEKLSDGKFLVMSETGDRPVQYRTHGEES